MKNIHVLPTDKPSRLFKHNNAFFIDKEFYESTPKVISQNIYITSDEEPKVNDFYFDFEYQKVRKCETGYYNKGSKKIILTTDQNLIKDGVQAIDDEFLEWFVQNPSCESVELVNYLVRISNFDWKTEYKIIIPKEETKQQCCENTNGFNLGTTCPYCKKPFRNVIKEPKQETLEEVRDLAYYKSNAEEDYLAVPISVMRYISQLEQQERSYSEEEVLDLLQKALTHQDDGETGSLVTAQSEIRPANFFSWFKKHKKK